MDKVLVIIGPTAVGKTALSIELAKKFNGEIINGDSVQVYKELDIGSAKIKPLEMDGIPHHLFDIKNPNDDFSVAEFQMLVRDKIHEISKRGKLPIICGGTGLYIQAVLYDFQFLKEGRSEDFREKYAHLSNEELYNRLKAIDEAQAKKMHPNNRRRIVRALEIYENNKETKTELLSKQKQELLYDAYIIGLDMDRALLYSRINKRVELMIENGLIEEVKMLYDKDYHVNAIGYKEFDDYFDGDKTIEVVIEDIKKNTRHYAKRQLTYFRNKLDVHWFKVNPDDIEELKIQVFKEIDNWMYQK